MVTEHYEGERLGRGVNIPITEEELWWVKAVTICNILGIGIDTYKNLSPREVGFWLSAKVGNDTFLENNRSNS